MIKKIVVKVCDVCNVDSKNVKEKLATKTCAVCERDFCNSPEHVGDEYKTTSHMGGYGEVKFNNFVCKECWKLSEYFGYKNNTKQLPHSGIDLHASGSTTAINMAEYREMIQSKAKQLSEDYLISLLKAVKEGVSVNLDANKIYEDIKTKLDSEKDELILKKKKEILGIE